MANTYDDATGVLIFDGPARLTPVIRMLFKPFKLDERPDVEGNERYIAVLSEDNNYDWPGYLNQVVDNAKRLIGLDLCEREDDADILKAIGAHFGASLDTLIASIDLDNFVGIGDVVRLAKALDDGHNLQGYCLEGAWHCDRPRLWEFGGWLSFSSQHYAFQIATSDILAFCRGVDHYLAAEPQAAGKAITVFAEELLDGIVDPTLRMETKFELIHQLRQRSLVGRDCDDGTDTSWTRSVYVGAYATDEGAGPAYARLNVTPRFIETLQSLRSLCVQKNLTEVHITAAPDEWGPGISEEALHLCAPELVVTPWLFWFSDYPKGMPFEIETRGHGIDRLMAEACGPGDPVYLDIEAQDVEAAKNTER